MISALAKNVGMQDINFQLKLFSGDDGQVILLEETPALNLNSGDSLIYTFHRKIIIDNSALSFIVSANAEMDEDTINNSLQKSIAPGADPFSVVINEFKFLPEDEEPEWIELYNRTTETINLKNWSVADLFTTPDSIILTKDNLFIEPSEYIVIAADSLIFNFYENIPAPVYSINLPTLNNDADAIILKDSLGVTIDSVLYFGSWSQRGFSVERISTELHSSDSSNWAQTIAGEKGTPGAINSVVLKQYDLAIDSIYFEPNFPARGEDINLTVRILNAGTSDAKNFEVGFFVNDELFEKKYIELLRANETIEINSEKTLRVLDSIKISAEIIYDSDENPSNNISEIIVRQGYANKTILINEIMYNPRSGNPEWVEFINVSDEEVNLRDWIFGDLLPVEKVTIFTEENISIKPNEFFIISSEDLEIQNAGLKIIQTNFSLSNTEDAIALYDFRGAIIDSLKYYSSWGNEKGISLERVSLSLPTNDSLNWKLSLSESGNSCGKENSLRSISSYDINSIVFNEIMFDPDISNSEFIEIYNRSEDSVNIGRWTIEDKTGENIFVSHHNKYLKPEEYFLIAADSFITNNYAFEDMENINFNEAGMNLSKTGEKLFLKDFFGNIIDSIAYDNSWHNVNIINTKNRSLEKISPALESDKPANWSTSVDELGATPLRANSIFTSAKASESVIEISPNPFSPDNDGFEDFTMINYKLRQPTSQIRIRIFDSRGRLVRRLADNLPSSAEGSIIFDGLDDDENPLRIGIYIVFFEALENSSGVTEAVKEVVVVARRL